MTQGPQSVGSEVEDLPYLCGLPEQFARLTDVTLVAEGVSLPAHKAILAANSPFFGDLFLSDSDNFSRNSGCHMQCPLPGDKLEDVLTVLKYCYQSCTLFSPTKPRLQSAKDACALARFAHKYIMPALLHECEDFLTAQARNVEVSNDSLDISSIVQWASIAEECNLSHLLAQCELIMAKSWDTNLWQHALLVDSNSVSRACLLRVLRAAQFHMISSEQRMQQMVVNRYNSFRTVCHADITDLVKWQQAA